MKRELRIQFILDANGVLNRVFKRWRRLNSTACPIIGAAFAVYGQTVMLPYTESKFLSLDIPNDFFRDFARLLVQKMPIEFIERLSLYVDGSLLSEEYAMRIKLVLVKELDLFVTIERNVLEGR